MAASTHTRVARRFLVSGLIPSAFYLAAFVALTGSLILGFSTQFFSDAGDGLQNVWNLWWVNRAVCVLHQSPWWTAALHHPQGTSLVGHTLNPFNGFVAIGLLRFLTLVQAHNAIVLLGFVGGGLGGFLLARHLGVGYRAALLAGFLFTFSSYHFAHAQGHLQLGSLEWIPFFLLCFIRLLDRPRIGTGVAAGLVLWLVLLCDYYYFFYCLLAAAVIAAWTAYAQRDGLWLVRRERAPAIGVFAATAALTCGPLVVALLVLGRAGLEGAHFARQYSMDLLALLVPGGHWRFAELTRAYWSRLPGNVHESSVHLGFAACALLALSLSQLKPWKGRDTAAPAPRHATALWLMLGAFAVLSLGPVLHVWGYTIGWFKLPYAVLAALLPPLRMSGMPVRMAVMVTLAASILIAAQVERLVREGGLRRLLAVVLVAMMIVECLPGPLPRVSPQTPAWVWRLAARSDGRFALLDLDEVEDQNLALYYQTVHRTPIVGGYIARVPTAAARKEREIRLASRTRGLQAVCEDYGVGYVIARPLPAQAAPVLYADADTVVYDLTRAWPCRAISGN